MTDSIHYAVQYDKEFENKLQKIYDTGMSYKKALDQKYSTIYIITNDLTVCASDTVTLKYKYSDYNDIIFDNTTLPKVLIDLICLWIDDEITLQIIVNYDDCIDVKSLNTCINFVNIQFEFSIFQKYEIYNRQFCENIVTYNREIGTIQKSMYIGCIINNIKITEKCNTYVIDSGLKLSIVNRELFLTICNLTSTIKNFINQLKN